MPTPDPICETRDRLTSALDELSQAAALEGLPAVVRHGLVAALCATSAVKELAEQLAEGHVELAADAGVRS